MSDENWRQLLQEAFDASRTELALLREQLERLVGLPDGKGKKEQITQVSADMLNNLDDMKKILCLKERLEGDREPQ